MTSDITFRFDERPSIPALGDLREAVGWARATEDYPAAFEGYSLTVSAHAPLRGLVGWLAVVSDDVRHAFLVDVIVHPEFHRQRIGTQLVLHSVERMRERGITLFHVDFAYRHAPFYRGCGFTLGGGGYIDLATTASGEA